MELDGLTQLASSGQRVRLLGRMLHAVSVALYCSVVVDGG